MAHPLQAVAVLGRDADDQRKLAIPFQHRGRLRPAQGRLDDGVDVAGIEAIASGRRAVHRDIQVRLAQDPEDAEIGDSPDPVHDPQDLRGDPFQGRQVAADNLDRVGALDARQALFNIVLDVLREVEGYTRELVREPCLQLGDQPLLRHARGPLLHRLQRREELGVAEPRRVAAVVRPAMLRDDRDDFGAAAQDLADAVDHPHARFQRDGRRHRGANPEIAFLESRQELAAEPGDEHARPGQEPDPDRDHDRPVRQRPVQDRVVDGAQRPHDDRFDMTNLLREQQRRQYRGDRERPDQRARQRVRVGPRHRAKDLSFDPLHGEQGDKRR